MRSAVLEVSQTAGPASIDVASPTSLLPGPWSSLNPSSRVARLFLPRRKFAKTCVAVTTSSDNSDALSHILEAINSSKDMLTAGQSAIVQAIAGVTPGGSGTCDLTGLTTGQQQILTEIANAATDLDQLDDILAAINTAKSMIIDGQSDITNILNDLSDALDTAKAMILAGQDKIINGIATVTSNIETTKTMLLDGQADITADIATLSSNLAAATARLFAAITDLRNSIADVSIQIDTAKSMILAIQQTIIGKIDDVSTQITNLEKTIRNDLTDIDAKVDALEAGQKKICDKIEALDGKLDTIIDKLMN